MPFSDVVTIMQFVPAINLAAIFIGGIFAVKMISSTSLEAMQLIRQIQSQHQMNSERISVLEAKLDSLAEEVEWLRDKINNGHSK